MNNIENYVHNRMNCYSIFGNIKNRIKNHIDKYIPKMPNIQPTPTKTHLDYNNWQNSNNHKLLSNNNFISIIDKLVNESDNVLRDSLKIDPYFTPVEVFSSYHSYSDDYDDDNLLKIINPSTSYSVLQLYTNDWSVELFYDTESKKYEIVDWEDAYETIDSVKYLVDKTKRLSELYDKVNPNDGTAQVEVDYYKAIYNIFKKYFNNMR